MSLAVMHAFAALFLVPHGDLFVMIDLLGQ